MYKRPITYSLPAKTSFPVLQNVTYSPSANRKLNYKMYVHTREVICKRKIFLYFIHDVPLNIQKRKL